MGEDEKRDGSRFSPVAGAGRIDPIAKRVGRGGLNGLWEEEAAAVGEEDEREGGGGGGGAGGLLDALPSAFIIGGGLGLRLGLGLEGGPPLEAATIPLSLPALPSSSSIATNILPT